MTDPDPALAVPAEEPAAELAEQPEPAAQTAEQPAAQPVPGPVRAAPSGGSRRDPRGATVGTATSVVSGLGAAVIGACRIVRTWSGAMGDGPPADSWVYRPGWTILQVALALLAVGSALLAVTAPGGRRWAPLVAAVLAAAVLGWSLDDGAYQLIGWLYYSDDGALSPAG